MHGDRAKWSYLYIMRVHEAVFAGHVRNAEITRALGVPPATFSTWRKRYPMLERAIGEALVGLIDEMSTYPRSAKRDATITLCHVELDKIAERTRIDWRDPPDRETRELIELENRVRRKRRAAEAA